MSYHPPAEHTRPVSLSSTASALVITSPHFRPPLSPSATFVPTSLLQSNTPLLRFTSQLFAFFILRTATQTPPRTPYYSMLSRASSVLSQLPHGLACLLHLTFYGTSNGPYTTPTPSHFATNACIGQHSAPLSMDSCMLMSSAPHQLTPLTTPALSGTPIYPLTPPVHGYS